ncbi:hypothetical protein BCIN_05g07970 [Botrytis cinerea B05.10]|uniref:BTB domain-containing protein n=1 Tax=Botryotinia fuckeliana (strain B05.10) TaxID=332648 RepID=A0A384JIN5_BOTFB|nr:hypothetical protein BCIN_05g07970 [Botrytis cinerea B05.10]ATZ50446.1 hypothetical protein BCIN_05g07970 [Botrytis cinerea B05.10]
MTFPTPRKRDADGNEKIAEPIVLHQPGFLNDVRLVVFGQVYHAHSIILKLNSKYFRSALEWGEKHAIPLGNFRYNFTSVVDEDGFWLMELIKSASNFGNHTNTNKLRVPQTEEGERRAFEAVLFAFYNRPYIIHGYENFKDIFRSADSLCARPALSHTLDSAFHRSPGFTDTICQNSDALIRIAKELHHPVLFRECLIYVVSKASSTACKEQWQSKFDDDEDIKSCFLKALQSVDSTRNLVDRGIETFSKDSRAWQEMLMVKDGMMDGTLEYQSATYYREVMNRLEAKELKNITMQWYQSFLTLLSSNLALDRNLGRVGEERSPGTQSNKNGFFCVRIRDEDLPWDQNIVDW